MLEEISKVTEEQTTAGDENEVQVEELCRFDFLSLNHMLRRIHRLTQNSFGNSSNAQNDWHGAWWHSSLAFHSGFVEEDSPFAESGQKGTYYFEFSRPLRTIDRFQQDVQFVIGQQSKVAVAFWYPAEGKPWSGSQHYSANCDWMPLDIASPLGVSTYRETSNGSWDAVTAFALLMSVIAFVMSAFIGYWVSKTPSVPFTPIDRL